MSEPVAAAGLSSADVEAWRVGEPAATAAFDMTGPYLTRGEELLGRLPARPDRNDAEAGAAALLKSGSTPPGCGSCACAQRPSTPS